MSIVLTPEFGPRNRFGVILTTAEIEPDPMYDGPKLCDPTKCDICVKSCPYMQFPPTARESTSMLKWAAKPMTIAV
jgi:epoxyqueuosine reductase QueG